MSACAHAQWQSPAGIWPALPSSFFHNVKQPASRHLPRSTSRSRGASLRRGLSFLFVSTASPLTSPTIRRACARNLGRHQFRPRNEGGRRSAGRRHCRRRARKVATLTLARRARPAQPGRPPLGAPPWRCRPRPALPLRHCRRVGRDGLLAPGAFLPDCGAGLFVSTGYEPRSTPLTAPPAGSSPEDAPHERGWRIFYYIFVT
jgi:hypothetical protein